MNKGDNKSKSEADQEPQHESVSDQQKEKNADDAGNTKKSDKSIAAKNKQKPVAKSKPTQKNTSIKSKAKVVSGGPKQTSPWLMAGAGLFALAALVISMINLNAIRSGDSEQLVLQNANQKLGAEIQDLKTQLATLQQQNNQIQGIAQANQQGQSSLSVSVENISKTLKQRGKRPIRWKLAEVEYLLSVANHQLLLEQDVNTALSALTDADNQLEAIGDPALIPIRKKIAAEKIALNSVRLPDIIGMSLRLANLVTSISQLPLISNKRAFVAETKNDQTHQVDHLVENWQEIPKAIWNDIRGLVTVRRSSTPIEPLLPPAESQYLAQNLGLKLEQSRLALLRRDSQLYRRNLKETRSWVNQYFDKEDAAVNTVIHSVDEMLNVELQPELPDISGSLRALRRWLEDNDQTQTAKTVRSPTPTNRGALQAKTLETVRISSQ